MNSFFGRLLNRPVAVAMSFGVLLAGGLFALTRLPIELSPSIEFPSLSIHTSWGNTSPETVEMHLTAPIEEIANTVRGVRKVSSTSREGRSRVSVEFEQRTNMNFARLELREKLAAFSENLPAGVSPPSIEPYVPDDFRGLQGFLSYSLAGSMKASELRRYAEEKIAPALMTIRGVAKVEVFGGEQREIQIEIVSERTAALSLELENILSAIRSMEYNSAVGALEKGNGRQVISVRNAEAKLSDIEHIVVGRSSGGAVIRLADIGTARDGYADPHNFYRINGKPSVTVVIDKEPNINTLRVAAAVFGKVAELRETFPHGMEILKEMDKSQQMREELDRLYQEILLSLFCIWFVLVVFLGNFKAPLILLSSILFSIAGTFLVFWLLGVGLNLLTLAGLVLGFGRLVDDSIVVLDNIQRHRRVDAAQASIVNAVRQIALPVTASTLTTVGAMLPLSFLPEDLKPYFAEFGIAVAVSLLMSLVVSFTLIPTLTHHVRLTEPSTRMWTQLASSFSASYQWVLRHALRRRKLVLILAMWMLGIPLWLLPKQIESESKWAALYNSTFGSEWFVAAREYLDPALGASSYLFFTKVTKGELWEWGNETYLVVRVGFPQGTDIDKYNDVAAAVEREVTPFSASLRKITTRVVDDYSVVRIDFTDASAVTALPYELKNRLTVFAAQTGGATISVAGFGPGFYSGGESAPSFYVKVLGYNYNKVKDIAEQFRQRIERNPRVAEVDIDRSFGRWAKSHELVVRVDRDAIAAHGLTVVDVVRVIRTYCGGALEYNALNFSGERIPYTVRFAGYKDFSTSDLAAATVTNSRGESIRLSELIGVEEQRVPSEIVREDQQYLRYISFEYRGPYRYGDAFVNTSIEHLPVPSGYKFDRSSNWFMFSEKDHISLLWIALIAAVIVFMVTASLYESFKKPFVIILSIPFSLVGLFLAYYLTDTPFGRGGYAAIILLIGIVVTNSIVLVDYVSKKLSDEGVNQEVLVKACSNRLRPILMTTLTTIGGLIPMLFIGEQTSIWYSLALGTIGGLTSSMMLTLVLIPILLSLLYKAK